MRRSRITTYARIDRNKAMVAVDIVELREPNDAVLSRFHWMNPYEALAGTNEPSRLRASQENACVSCDVLKRN